MSLHWHLEAPCGLDHRPERGHSGAAGGAACGDLVRISVSLDRAGRVVDAGFAASGCAAIRAAGSAVVSLVRGEELLRAARIGPPAIEAELGGLTPAGRHAAELAADALHRALGAALAGGRELRLEADAQRTLVAMSGGVDSAVAALLCGPGAVGVTLELWADPENDAQASCCSASAVRHARALAHGLGMAHLTLDLREAFRAGVVEPWLAGHGAGETPNPCVACNARVRLPGMLELAGRLGARALATGHYARVRDGLLREAADPAKDQSYVLAGLAPEQIARMRFPLGELAKGEVRARAEQAGLAVARKPDSQDLCFLAGTGRRRFFARHGGPAERPGELRDRDGRTLGHHQGAHLYTVGQRRGIGLGGGEPRYVLATDVAANVVVVGARSELGTVAVDLRDVALHRAGEEVDRVRLRSHGRAVACRVRGPAGRHPALRVELAEPAVAAPGQSACLMAGELVVGEGTIAGANQSTAAS